MAYFVGILYERRATKLGGLKIPEFTLFTFLLLSVNICYSAVVDVHGTGPFQSTKSPKTAIDEVTEVFSSMSV